MSVRVIVIDDDHLWLTVVKRQLEAADIAVQPYDNVHDAIDAISEATDVIIVDLLLGYNTIMPLLHELQSDGEVASIPIIVCSNIAETLPDASLREYGVRAVLDKTTLRPGDLVTAIRRVVL